MALTEEQRRIAQQVAMESPSPQYEEDLVTFAERFVAALPKPEVVEDFIYRFKRHVGGDGEFWLHELEDFYTESTIAQPASAPSEQKPVAYFLETAPYTWQQCWPSETGAKPLYEAPHPDYKAQRDAERYRWMKSEGKCMRVDTFKDNYRIVDASVDLVVTDWFKSFDAAIDAAMKG